MVKILGSVIIISCGVAFAYLLNGKARTRLIQLEGFIELVRYLRAQIDCFSMPIPTALARCPGGVLEKCGVRSCENIRTVRDLIDECDCSAEEIGELMRGFAADVGRGYKYEQLALCDRTIERLEEHRETLAATLPARNKLNGTLCVCFSLAVVILLI